MYLLTKVAADTFHAQHEATDQGDPFGPKPKVLGFKPIVKCTRGLNSLHVELSQKYHKIYFSCQCVSQVWEKAFNPINCHSDQIGLFLKGRGVNFLAKVTQILGKFLGHFKNAS